MRTSTAALISALTVFLISAQTAAPTAADIGPKRHAKPQGAATGSVGTLDPFQARSENSGLAETAIQARQLESMLGREIRTPAEENVGRIIDLLADRHGKVQAAVVEVGGFLGIGTRKIAVEWTALRFESGNKQPIVILEMSRDQLRRAPEYRPGEPVVVGRAVQ